jgi:hypothetical protein
MAGPPSYFVRHAERVRGPYSLEELRDLASEGRLPADVEIAESTTPGLFYPRESLAYLLEPRVRAPAGGMGPLRASARAAAPVGASGARPSPSWPAAVALLLAAASLALALVVDRFVEQRFRVAQENDGGTPAFSFIHGWRGIRFEVESAASPISPREEARRRAFSGSARSYRELLARADAEGRVEIASVGFSAGALRQTQWLGLGTVILLGAGLLLGLPAAFLRPGRGLPAGLALGVGTSGALALATSQGQRFLGVFHGDVALLDPRIREVLTSSGPSWAGTLASALLLLVAGLALGAGEAARARRRRYR